MTSDPDDQIKRMLSEMKEGSWYANASERARRRKSPWNLLLPLLFFPLWMGFLLLGVEAASVLHMVMHPRGGGLLAALLHRPMNGPRLMIFLPLLLASITPALMLSNFLIYRIPPARRAMDKEDRGYAAVDYDASQRALFKFGAVIALLAAVPVAIGAWLS